MLRAGPGPGGGLAGSGSGRGPAADRGPRGRVLAGGGGDPGALPQILAQGPRAVGLPDGQRTGLCPREVLREGEGSPGCGTCMPRAVTRTGAGFRPGSKLTSVVPRPWGRS